MDFKKSKITQNNSQTVRPSKPVVNSFTKPVSAHVVNNVANKVPENHQTNGKKEEKKKEKKSNNKIIMYAMGVFLVLIVALVIVIVVVNNGRNTDGGEDINVNRDTRILSDDAATTEDEDKITKEVLEHYAEVKIEGYKEVEAEGGSYGAIEVDVKNISDRTISLAVDVVAKDKDGNILDKTSLYAEGMEPEQSYMFNLFSNSELTKEQLQSATVEVLRAYTYGTEGSDTAGEVTESVSPESSETELNEEVKE